mmetsp:Transcript_52872/g.132972  ORF Transcript_52872/g.132972 Transcript_52872/m.132972 type:complete len:412 (-) Transcript_52872:1196-2431(-)
MLVASACPSSIFIISLVAHSWSASVVLVCSAPPRCLFSSSSAFMRAIISTNRSSMSRRFEIALSRFWSPSPRAESGWKESSISSSFVTPSRRGMMVAGLSLSTETSSTRFCKFSFRSRSCSCSCVYFSSSCSRSRMLSASAALSASCCARRASSSECRLATSSRSLAVISVPALAWSSSSPRSASTSARSPSFSATAVRSSSTSSSHLPLASSAAAACCSSCRRKSSSSPCSLAAALSASARGGAALSLLAGTGVPACSDDSRSMSLIMSLKMLSMLLSGDATPAATAFFFLLAPLFLMRDPDLTILFLALGRRALNVATFPSSQSWYFSSDGFTFLDLMSLFFSFLACSTILDSAWCVALCAMCTRCTNTWLSSSVLGLLFSASMRVVVPAAKRATFLSKVCRLSFRSGN